MTLKRRPARRHCIKGCRCSDGLSDEISKSTMASGAGMLSVCVFTRRKRSHRDLISSLRRPTPPALEAARNATRSIPIIFLQVSDPVGGGFVESLAHPGGNITGFTNFESEIGGKWLQTLKEIAPSLGHVAVVLHPETSAHAGFLRARSNCMVARYRSGSTGSPNRRLEVEWLRMMAMNC